MSAALRQVETPISVSAPAAPALPVTALTEADPATETPAPRPTGPQLMRRLLSRPENRYRLYDPEIVPLIGEMVLKVIAHLVATSETGELLVLDLTLGTLERRVMQRLRKWLTSASAEAQIAEAIGKLAAAQLVVRSDQGLSLPLPPEPEAVAGRGDGFKPFGNSPGTRPGGFSDALWSDYRRLHSVGLQAQKTGDLAQARATRERMDRMRSAQRSLLMPMGHSGQQAASQYTAGAGGHFGPHIVTETHIGADIGQDIGREILGSDIRADIETRSDIAGSQAATAAALASENIDIQAEAAVASDSAARASGGEPISILKSELISAPSISAAAISDADILAADIVRRFGMSAAAAAGVTSRVQGWLDAGLPPTALRDLLDRKEPMHREERAAGRPGIRGPAYFDQPVSELLSQIGEHRRLAGVQSSVTRPVPANGRTEAAEPIAPDPDCPAELAESWDRVRAALRTRFGASGYRTWLREMRLVGSDAGELTIGLPSRFKADRVRTEYGEGILAAWRQEGCGIQEVVFTVDSRITAAAPGGSP